MNYQQYQQLAAALQQQGWSQQDIISALGPPPQQTFGNYLMPPSGGAFSGTSGTVPPGVGTPSAPPNPIQQILQSLFGGLALGAEKAPYDLQMKAARLGMNPAALSSLINRTTRQLSPQLIHSVTRATTPGIAERGLATSGGMSEQIIAEALAPYQLQEQQMAQNQVFQGMGYPFQVGSGIAGGYPSDLAQFPDVMMGR
jgi:hypothetical protein